jgi:hypothetical protein
MNKLLKEAIACILCGLIAFTISILAVMAMAQG